MERYSAEWVGDCADLKPFRGIVHSVYDQTCNIADAYGLRLVLTRPEIGRVPHGVAVTMPREAQWFALLRAGTPVGLRAGLLRLGSTVTVDLRVAHMGRTALHRTLVDLAQPDQQRAWAIADRTVTAFIAAQPDTHQQAWHSVTDLASNLLVQLDRSHELNVRTMIGYGPGLTPAGDDFVVGLLAGLWCGRNGRGTSRVQDVGSQVLHSLTGTTDVSSSYLTHAAHGYFAEPLRNLALHIARGSCPQEIEAATNAACGVGATSGAAGVLGLLSGLQVAMRPVPIPANNGKG
jgi:hypothetical protein